MSSLNPSFSFGMSFGPSAFFVPPGLRLPLRSLRVSMFSFEDPFIIAPILGIELACEVPTSREGVASNFSSFESETCERMLDFSGS